MPIRMKYQAAIRNTQKTRILVKILMTLRTLAGRPSINKSTYTCVFRIAARGRAKAVTATPRNATISYAPTIGLPSYRRTISAKVMPVIIRRTIPAMTDMKLHNHVTSARILILTEFQLAK